MSERAQNQLRPSSPASFTPAPSGVLRRLCACGNHTVGGGECAKCAKKKSGLQRKLAMGSSNDPLEREADRVTDQVLAVSAHPAFGGASLRIQRYAGQAAEGSETAPASVDRALAGSGRPLEPVLRQDMEQRFGHDFSQVRVHAGAAAGQSAREVGANAYTVGHHIVFGAGRFAPGTHEGRRLVAHELTHVVQQLGAEERSNVQRDAQRGPPSIAYPGRGLETNGGALLQRDLALEPTNPNPQAANLTAGQIRDAIDFNRRRYDAENTRLIQNVVGASRTGVFDEETIRLIAHYQDGFGLAPADGKVVPDTFGQLTAELQAENADDQTCLTMFDVSHPTDPLDLHAAGPGLADIFSRFEMRAAFSPHCHCDEFQYRQFICGTVDRTHGGVATNMNNFFAVPGGGLPQCPGWVEDGDATQLQNGRYGHRDPADSRVNNRYLDNTGAVDMANGCGFAAFDVPGLFNAPADAGDLYDFDIRFFGDIRRNGRRMQRKFWAVRDNITIP